MKINNIFKGAAIMAAGALLTGCNSDYLELAPETSISNNEITANVENARKAILGICMTMQFQYSGTTLNNFLCNGESNIDMFFGESIGQDLISPICIGRQFPKDFTMYNNWNNQSSFPNYIPWEYYYQIIAQANLILDGIDGAEGTESEVNFVKAQALTFRAHAYNKLMEFYGPRWQDSNNGGKYALVMRLHSGTEPVPLSTVNDTYKQIYEDLDTAIECYKNSEESREYKWEPDLSVAYGTYARAALNKQDWSKAKEMAKNARADYRVMDNDTYHAGFFKDNDDFMWRTGDEPSDIYYYSWGSLWAANGAYTSVWNWGGNSIDLSLYNQLDPKDTRRKCFLTPDKIDELSLSTSLKKANITRESFWEPELVGVGSACIDLAAGPTKADKNKPNQKWGLYNVALRICEYYVNNVFTGNKADILNEGNSGIINYYAEGATGVELLSKGVYGSFPQKAPFGAQFKFMANVPYGNSCYPFMRASEMCLIEAEAAYMDNDRDRALACLKEINDQRIEGYSFNSKDESLLNEIKLCRRIELWGEGRQWNDLKRWNQSINRVKWDKETKTGNWIPDVAGTIAPSAANGWRFTIPLSETQYNTAINISLLN